MSQRLHSPPSYKNPGLGLQSIYQIPKVVTPNGLTVLALRNSEGGYHRRQG
jgi:hypothetical protein